MPPKKQRIMLLSRGICVDCCKNPVLPGHTRCLECNNKHNNGTKLLKQAYKSEGKCAHCGKPLLDESEGVLCTNCAEGVFNFKWN